MSDVALANEPEARTPTGEIKDQSPAAAPPPSTTTAPSPTTETKPQTPSTTTDKPAEGDKPSLANEKPAETKAPEGAPEKYEAWKVPDGFEMPEEVTKEVGKLFKDLNLSQEAGQKLVDYYAQKNQEAAQAPFKLWQDTQEKWRNEVKLDPEIGPKMDQVKTVISKALDSLDPALTAQFREAMDYTGAGNNLAFIKTFYRLASMITEGGHVAGRAPSEFGQRAPGQAERPSAARALYPNLS